MITEIKMWTANCDICNVDYGIIMSQETEIAEDIDEVAEWIITKEGKTYCTDCHTTCSNDETDENEVFSKDLINSGATFLGVEQQY